MTPRPAIALAFGLAATPAFAENGQEWLARMGAALSNASYLGEFVSESAGRTERFAITHRVLDGVVSERLVSLSGHGRELVRENDEVVVYLPDQKLAIIERRSGRSDLLGSLPQFEGRMAAWYKVDWVGRETLDDFGPTAVVAVRPLDSFRFGYRLWIDVDSHMPVRSDLSDGSGRVIERLRFTRLKFDNAIPDSAFEPALDRRKLRWVRQSPQSDDEAPAWRGTGPAGVPPVRQRRAGARGPERAGRPSRLFRRARDGVRLHPRAATGPAPRGRHEPLGRRVRVHDGRGRAPGHRGRRGADAHAEGHRHQPASGGLHARRGARRGEPPQLTSADAGTPVPRPHARQLPALRRFRRGTDRDRSRTSTCGTSTTTRRRAGASDSRCRC